MKRNFMFVLLLALSAFIAACAAEPEVITERVEVVVTQVVEKVVEVEGETQVVTQIVTEVEEVEVEVTRVVEVEAEMEEEGGAMGEASDTYTIGIFEDPITLNYWSYLGPDNSVWTAYALAETIPSVYSLALPGSVFIPSLAADLPPAPEDNGDGTFSITVPLISGPTWSDGEAIDANDVAFTYTTCIDLQLTGNWASICKLDALVGVEAVDDTTVKYTFNTSPGLAQWQYGVAIGPVLPEHMWADTVAEAMAFVGDAELPEDCSEEAPEEDQTACNAYEDARKTLYGAEVPAALSGSSLVANRLEAGAFVQKTANADSYFAGTTYTEYSDGTYMETWADGSQRMYYGEGGGDVTLEWTQGPKSQNVILSTYGSQDAAYLALQDGEVDYVLNPLGASPGLVASATASGGVTSYTNADNGLFYFAFNMRKAPYSDLAFRTAFDVLVDKEFVTGRILQGTVSPAHSIVPPGNAFWASIPERAALADTLNDTLRDEDGNVVADAIPSTEELLGGVYSWIGLSRDARVEVS